MLQPCNQHLPPHKAEGVSPTDTWLDVAVKVVRETLAAKIIAAPRTDEAAVVFYGPRVARARLRTTTRRSGRSIRPWRPRGTRAAEGEEQE